MNEIDLSWAAGMFAGDGCATITKDKRSDRWSFVMVIVMKDYRSINRFYEVAYEAIGPFRARPNTYKMKYKDSFSDYRRMQLAAGPAERLGLALLPYMAESDKADQIVKKMEEVKAHNLLLVDRPRHPHAKKNWTPKQIRKMRKRHSKGDLVADIATDYGVSPTMMNRIVKGTAYAYV